MSIRNFLYRNLDLKSHWIKSVIRPRSLQTRIQHGKCMRILNTRRTQKFGKSLFLVDSKIPSWKWLISISIVYAGYDDKNIFDIMTHGTVADLIEYMKDNSKDVNKHHRFGWTPLHIAAAKNKYKHVEVLLKYGADPNISVTEEMMTDPADVPLMRDKYFIDNFYAYTTVQGFTALHYAALYNNIESLKILINYGANPNLESVTGYKPIDLVTDDKVHDLLREYENNFELIKKKREAEERKNFPLELRLKKRIVGQESAIKVVASAIRRKENGWTDDEHPLVFLFLGSSGIGKTELAKQIAKYIHKDNEDGFIRLDMSEYQQNHEVAKMIGSPPGYVGHDNGGFLTKKLSKNPNAVVLFDEVEKAHRDVLTILLQLFDEGRITDGKGKTIECKNAIFVMTSNLASGEIAEHALDLRKEPHENKLKEDFRLSENKMEKHDDDIEMYLSRQFKDKIVKPILKRHFKRDEFLGRINEIVYFLPFSETELKTIVQRELTYWQEFAMKKHKVKIEWDSAVEHVIIGAYDVSYGARSIKHEVERSVVSQIAKAHEKGVIKENTVIKIVADMTKGDCGTVLLKILHNNKFLNVDEIAS